MHSIKISSPAKINLYLRVLGRQQDGYHSLLTLFHRLSLSDTLVLRKIKHGFRLRSNHPGLPTDQTNLITRAYHALKKEYPNLGGISVSLTKRIPMGGGLGGGSSNAASFLLGARRLYRLKASRERLVRIGRTLGADVPFFLYEAILAMATGRGDRIHPVRLNRPWHMLLILSRKGLNTKEVYEAMPRRRSGVSLTKEKQIVRMLCYFLNRGDYSKVADFLRNDLEESAFALRPSLRALIAKIERLGIQTVRMSGSGPTVFAAFPSLREAKQALQKLRNRFPSKEIVLVSSC